MTGICISTSVDHRFVMRMNTQVRLPAAPPDKDNHPTYMPSTQRKESKTRLAWRPRERRLDEGRSKAARAKLVFIGVRM